MSPKQKGGGHIVFGVDSVDLCAVLANFTTLFSFCSPMKCWILGLDTTKCLTEKQTGKTLIRLLFLEVVEAILAGNLCWKFKNVYWECMKI